MHINTHTLNVFAVRGPGNLRSATCGIGAKIFTGHRAVAFTRINLKGNVQKTQYLVNLGTRGTNSSFPSNPAN